LRPHLSAILHYWEAGGETQGSSVRSPKSGVGKMGNRRQAIVVTSPPPPRFRNSFSAETAPLQVAAPRARYTIAAPPSAVREGFTLPGRRVRKLPFPLARRVKDPPWRERAPAKRPGGEGWRARRRFIRITKAPGQTSPDPGCPFDRDAQSASRDITLARWHAIRHTCIMCNTVGRYHAFYSARP
jgi:hypothetical protein